MADDSRDTDQDDHNHGRAYLIAIVALLLLTGLSFALAQVEIAGGGLVLALVVAAIKASIVAMIFMHLRYSSNTTRMVFVFTILFIALLAGGVMADIATR